VNTQCSFGRQQGLLPTYCDYARTSACGCSTALLCKGRPKLHGDKFKLSDSSTWSEPVAILEVEDQSGSSQDSTIWVALSGSSSSPGAIVEDCRFREWEQAFPKPMWLGWLGGDMPCLSRHGDTTPQVCGRPLNRFAKQRLHWTLPPSTTKLAERWSDLMPLMSWQLWLAREVVKDHPLPWQKHQVHLTPGRVAQGFAAILAVIHTGR